MNEVCAPGIDARELIERLGLTPHPEGGWFRFICESGVRIKKSALPEGYGGGRDTCSLIYYMLMNGEVSRWHRLLSPEIWAWHCGGGLAMTMGGAGALPAGEREVLLGPRTGRGEDFQLMVPAGVWQTTRVLWGDFALVSCIVSPAYDDADFYMPAL